MMREYVPRGLRGGSGSGINRAPSPVVATMVPWGSVILASLVPMLPIIASAPILPPTGFLMLLAWRLVRPGLLPVWSGVVLGAFDDLYSGQPFGFGIMMWSIAMLTVEGIETRFPWRGFVQDWLVAAILSAAYVFSAAILAGGGGEADRLAATMPQLLLSLLLFPIFARMVSSLDRFRLIRVRTVG